MRAVAVLFDWWRDRSRPRSAQATEKAAYLREREDASGHRCFMLEALEPRVLLSADPVLGDLALWVSDDDSIQRQDDLAVICEELDAATAASTAGANPPPTPDTSSIVDSAALIEWPVGMCK